MAQTKRRTRAKTRSSMGSIASNATKSMTPRGAKGGMGSRRIRVIKTQGIKGGVAALRSYANQVMKTSRKIGSKGGAAALVGGAAGMAIGAALAGMMLNKKNDNVIKAAESISKHADDLKKVAGKK